MKIVGIQLKENQQVKGWGSLEVEIDVTTPSGIKAMTGIRMEGLISVLLEVVSLITFPSPEK